MRHLIELQQMDTVLVEEIACKNIHFTIRSQEAIVIFETYFTIVISSCFVDGFKPSTTWHTWKVNPINSSINGSVEHQVRKSSWLKNFIWDDGPLLCLYTKKYHIYEEFPLRTSFIPRFFVEYCLHRDQVNHSCVC